jgi:hypothetical protein
LETKLGFELKELHPFTYKKPPIILYFLIRHKIKGDSLLDNGDNPIIGELEKLVVT